MTGLQSISCPHCAAPFLYDGSAAGALISCSRCGQEFALPGEQPPASEEHDESLELQYHIYGQHPVQAEGRVQGHPYYFRAKWDFWGFTACVSGDNPELPSFMIPPEDEPGFFRDCGQEGFYLSEYWGQGTDASEMPLDVAHQIIQDCARKLIDALGDRESSTA